MNKLQNENQSDRLIRFLFGEVFLLLAYFWLGGIAQIICYVLGVIAIFTALTGFCAAYKLLGINTAKKYPKPLSKKIFTLFAVVLIALPIAGGYYSNFFSKKFFLEDYNQMNNYYKQTLFNTGQNLRQESIENYEKLLIEYQKFNTKYSVYHPAVIKNDPKFNNDLSIVEEKIVSAKDEVRNGDLAALHKKFEEIRPIFQDILKRNGFSMLAVSLVDFHDSMEKVIDAADKQDAAGVITAYTEADSKFQAVEAEANDEEIKTIRDNLEAVLELAKNNQVAELSQKAAELKSSFVKVYLKRG
jgi:hypothetical protein